MGGEETVAFQPVPPFAGGQQVAFQKGSHLQAELTTESAAPGDTKTHPGSGC